MLRLTTNRQFKTKQQKRDKPYVTVQLSHDVDHAWLTRTVRINSKADFNKCDTDKGKN